VSETEWFSGIEQYQLQVSRNSTVLEAIIEQQEFHIELFGCDLSRRNPIGRLQVRHIWEQPFQLFSFVVSAVDACSIASRQNRNSFVLLPKPAS
jgi:hypothetical protein